MPINIDFFKSPDEVIKYLKQKHPELHFNYDEIRHNAHHRAFTVAKITKLDLLKDIQESLTNAYKKGESFEAWKKDITPTLQKKGWFGETEVINPETGEVKKIYVGNRRLKTIYKTNMKVAYAQARYQTQMESKGEYFRYIAVLDNRTRPTHASHHGLILPKDDPFWDTHYPPNAWNCRCKVRVYTKKQVERKGWKVGNEPLSFAHKDWDYHVGKTDNNARLLKIYRDKTGTITDKGLKDRAKKEYVRLKEKKLQEETAKKASDTLAEMFEGIDITIPGRRPPLKKPMTIGILSSSAKKKLKEFGLDVPTILQIITQKKLTHGMRASKIKKGDNLSKEDFINMPIHFTEENLYYSWDNDAEEWGMQFLWENENSNFINYASFGYRRYKGEDTALFGLTTYGKSEKKDILDDIKGKKRIKM